MDNDQYDKLSQYVGAIVNRWNSLCMALSDYIANSQNSSPSQKEKNKIYEYRPKKRKEIFIEYLKKNNDLWMDAQELDDILEDMYATRNGAGHWIVGKGKDGNWGLYDNRNNEVVPIESMYGYFLNNYKMITNRIIELMK